MAVALDRELDQLAAERHLADWLGRAAVERIDC
jgi:hypothetical protein